MKCITEHLFKEDSDVPMHYKQRITFRAILVNVDCLARNI